MGRLSLLLGKVGVICLSLSRGLTFGEAATERKLTPFNTKTLPVTGQTPWTNHLTAPLNGEAGGF